MERFEFRPKLLSALQDYSKQKFLTDLMAGIVVAIVAALPLAIAFGIASGVSPEKGLVTAIVSGLLIAALGGSRVQIAGPTGAFIVILQGIIQQFGEQGLIVATLLSGVVLILLGVLKLGTIIKFIPYPIIVGFTSGIALTIFASQIKDLLGLSIDKVPTDFIEKWTLYFQNIHTLDWPSAIMGIATVIVISLSHKVTKKVPGSLIAIVLMTLIAYLLRHFAGIGSIETIGDRFIISASLPKPEMPVMSFELVQNLLAPAFTIAILGAIESLLTATVADGVIGDRHDSNQELVALGIGNFVAPLFGGIPATGALARTMTNINNGGRTPVAGIIHAVVLLLSMFCLSSVISLIPMSCLAGVLVIVSYNMSEWRTFRSLLKNPKSDVAVLVVTFILTVIFNITIALEVGLMIACLLFMQRVMESTRISITTDEIDLSAEADFVSDNMEKLTIPDGVEVYEIDGPYFFGIANKFEEQMAQMGDRPLVRVIRMRKVPFIDSTGIHNLESLCRMAKKEKIQIVLSGVNPKVHQVLDRAGFYDILGDENICGNIQEALDKAQEYTNKARFSHPKKH